MVREWRGLVKQETSEPVSPFIGRQRFIKQRKKAMMSAPMQKSRRHALGQHFLTNPGVLRKIVGAIDPKPGDVIVEIGAGKGVLTAALAESAGRVIAIEKDERLIPGLREKMPANVEVLHGDILRTDLRQVSKAAGVPALRLVGNIPYSISSPLLFRVLDERGILSDCVFLLQKEVAARVIAGPGTKSYAPWGSCSRTSSRRASNSPWRQVRSRLRRRSNRLC